MYRSGRTKGLLHCFSKVWCRGNPAPFFAHGCLSRERAEKVGKGIFSRARSGRPSGARGGGQGGAQCGRHKAPAWSCAPERRRRLDRLARWPSERAPRPSIRRLVRAVTGHGLFRTADPRDRWMRGCVLLGRADRALSDGGRLLVQDCALRFGQVPSDADLLTRCQANAAGKGGTRFSGAPNRSALMSSTNCASCSRASTQWWPCRLPSLARRGVNAWPMPLEGGASLCGRPPPATPETSERRGAWRIHFFDTANRPACVAGHAPAPQN